MKLQITDSPEVDLSDNDYLFIEWEIVSIINSGYNNPTISEYDYNMKNHSLRTSKTLDPSKKFIFGYRKKLDSASLKVEQKYLYQLTLDSVRNINHTSFFIDLIISISFFIQSHCLIVVTKGR